MQDFDASLPWHSETLGLRAGQRRTQEREHSEPIFATSSYVFGSAAEAAKGFSGKTGGNVYSRFTNPTVRGFEQRLAALEEGDYAIATSSGMAAIAMLTLSCLKQGDHVLAARGMFGSTTSWLEKYLARFGIEVSFVSLADLDAWRAGVRAQTRMFLVETPTNPLGEMADIQALSHISKEAGALLAVDNCFATPIFQKPLNLGADVVIHSATKYLDGQGRCIGGALVTRSEALWEEFFGYLRAAGPSMSPFNAWTFSKGLETLALRMRAHTHNAQVLATWLQAQPGVARVFYPGLESHAQHKLAQRQMQGGYGGIVSVEFSAGRDAAWRFIDATQMVSITGNLGDARTTITHPATTTHGRLSDEAKAASGITEGLVRISVGLEHIDDLIGDLSCGLA